MFFNIVAEVDPTCHRPRNKDLLSVCLSFPLVCNCFLCGKKKDKICVRFILNFLIYELLAPT